jgi:hypothetical protein
MYWRAARKHAAAQAVSDRPDLIRGGICDLRLSRRTRCWVAEMTARMGAWPHHAATAQASSLSEARPGTLER